MSTELHDKLAFLTHTQFVNSGTGYVCKLWEKLVTTAAEEYALLREIENLKSSKAFELIKTKLHFFQDIRHPLMMSLKKVIMSCINHVKFPVPVKCTL